MKKKNVGVKKSKQKVLKKGVKIKKTSKKLKKNGGKKKWGKKKLGEKIKKVEKKVEYKNIIKK